MDEKPRLVHRLDKETSGVLLLVVPEMLLAFVEGFSTEEDT